MSFFFFGREIIESMERLIAVPSEKIRVWCCWLSMVGEEIHEWRHWLLSHINLVLRISEIMKKIQQADEHSKAGEKNLIEVKLYFPYIINLRIKFQ